jgi:hypothetical protein
MITGWQPFNGASFSKRRERKFAECLQFCERIYVVSEEMRQAYKERYGVDSSVLYPMRNFNLNNEPVEKSAIGGERRFLICHAGTLYKDTIEGIDELTQRLGNSSMEFGIVGARNDDAVLSRLTTTRIRSFGYFKRPEDAMQVLKKRADILILIQPRSDQSLLRYSFPSKFVDYTSLDKPVVCIADEWSPIARFMIEHGLREYLFCYDYDSATRKIRELFANSAERERARATFRELGEMYFSRNAVMQIFQP